MAKKTETTKVATTKKATPKKATPKVSEPKIEMIKIDVKGAKKGKIISRVEVAQSEIDKNPQTYFKNIQQAQSEAKHQLNELKGSLDAEVFDDIKWEIELFS